MKINLKELTINKAHESLKKGEYTVTDLVNAYLEVIKEKNSELNAYLEVYDDVLAQAKVAEEMFKSGTATLMTGIPMAVKDNILIKGQIASACSTMLKNYTATYDSTIVEKLKKQGVVFLGRTNMDDSAMGGSTESSIYGLTKNPHDLNRVAGGSSGGSAVAVSANLALVSLGSDTGGSIREPASFCGIVGLKPTYGAVSRYGLMALGSSLDCIGPFAKTVEDVEIIFRAVAGHDVMDSTSVSEDTYPKPISKSKLNIGVPWSLVDQDGVDTKVKDNFKRAVESLEKLGHAVKDVSLPNLGLSLAIYYIIMPAEASSNLARYDGVRYGLHVDGKNLLEDYLLTKGKGYGKEVRRRILLGTYVLSSGYYDAYYSKAQTAREILKQEFTTAFKEFDLILTPTAPMPAWKIGEKSDPLSMYLADVFTVTANIIGVPSISIPSGFIEVEGKSLPLGIQFMAPHDHEELLFAIGKDFEKLV